MVEGGSVQPLDTTARRSGHGLALAAIALVVATGCAYASAARPACADAILEDWTNGALEATYPPDCYQAAIDALPEDLRAYTTAADDISRAAVAANRAPPTRQLASAPVADESVRALPVAVVVLAGLVTAVAATGVTACLVRRRRSR